MCHQLEGHLHDVMAGKSKLTQRYNNAAAVAMWLQRKVVDAEFIKARVGKRPFDDGSDLNELVQSPQGKSGEGRDSKKKAQPAARQKSKANSNSNTPTRRKKDDAPPNVRPINDHAVSAANLKEVTKTVKSMGADLNALSDSTFRCANSMEGLVRSVQTEMSAHSNLINAMNEKLNKVVARIGALETAVNKVNDVIGNPEFLSKVQGTRSLAEEAIVPTVPDEQSQKKRHGEAEDSSVLNSKAAATSKRHESTHRPAKQREKRRRSPSPSTPARHDRRSRHRRDRHSHSTASRKRGRKSSSSPSHSRSSSSVSENSSSSDASSVSKTSELLLCIRLVVVTRVKAGVH